MQKIDFDVYQKTYQNPHASIPLVLPLVLLCNTPEEVLQSNIRINSARVDLDWLYSVDPHAGVAMVCGGGPSLADSLETVRELQAKGGTVFAVNAASKYLSERGIIVDYQVIVDAQQATSLLVDDEACEHLIASQCHPDTLAAAKRPKLWHKNIDDIETFFPSDRVKRGGYSIFGGGGGGGNCATTVAYGCGFLDIHCFGLDSSHRGTASHAYSQPMNDGIPSVQTEWGGKTYISQVAMKAQAERFQITGKQLQDLGCKITVHGDGLLPAMWNTPPEELTEREKYTLLWRLSSYRDMSPGEEAVPTFLEVVKPTGRVIDFGCGTGRASLALKALGHDVQLVDFTDNCRDYDALTLPFIEWDLSRPGLPVRGSAGLCCDVLEHISEDQIEAVILNIMNAAPKVFFQISTVPDKFGNIIKQTLHLTVRPHDWWLETFRRLGYRVTFADPGDVSTQLLVENAEWH